MYEELNLKAKKYLLEELNNLFYKKYKDKELLERCYKEIELLYKNDLLFIIEYLYKFKNEYQDTKYYFRGTINNLFVLYVLGVNYVNPLEYNLPYELFSDKTINVDVINEPDILLVNYLDKQIDYFRLVHGFYVKEDIEEINAILENHYLLIPCGHLDSNMLLRFNDSNMLETTSDYRDYKDKYVSVRIDYKNPVCKNKISLDNVFNNEFEKKISKTLKPKTINDYAKIKSLAHGTNVWNNNQDDLVKNRIINLNNLIATREDIFDYLLNHKLDRGTALEITNFIILGKVRKEPLKWKEDIKLMKEYNCEDLFIEIFSKILFIFGRGQAISDCLYVLDKNNYQFEEER